VLGLRHDEVIAAVVDDPTLRILRAQVLDSGSETEDGEPPLVELYQKDGR
jgi:hypothetical protein